VFQRGDYRHRVVIGKDTRLSGYMIEYALVAGFTSVGMDVLLLGPIPTPAVAMLTKSMRADLGVMISASHNLFEDNGIKLFGPQGFKLSDDVEKQIEQLLAVARQRLAQAPVSGAPAHRRVRPLHRFAKRTLRGSQPRRRGWWSVHLARPTSGARRCRTRRRRHSIGVNRWIHQQECGSAAGSAGRKVRGARRHQHRARRRRRSVI
jgi:hypothetical protein